MLTDNLILTEIIVDVQLMVVPTVMVNVENSFDINDSIDDGVIT